MRNAVALSWLHQFGTTCQMNELKHCTNLNMFNKHKIKECFLYKIRQKDDDIYLYNWTLVFTTTDGFFL